MSGQNRKEQCANLGNIQELSNGDKENAKKTIKNTL